MERFYINCNESRRVAEEMFKIAKQIEREQDCIQNVSRTLKRGNSMEQIRQALNKQYENLNASRMEYVKYITTLNAVILAYEKTENGLLNKGIHSDSQSDGNNVGPATPGSVPPNEPVDEMSFAERTFEIAKIEAQKSMLKVIRSYVKYKLECDILSFARGNFAPAMVLNSMEVFDGGVVTMGLGGGVGSGIQGNGSCQVAFDQDGNINFTGTAGGGASTSPAGDVSFIIGIYPGMDSVDDVKGLGSNFGFTFGSGASGGIDIITSGTGMDAKIVGMTFSIGGGAGGDVHAGVSYTEGSPTINIYDIIDNAIADLDEKEKQYL